MLKIKTLGLNPGLNGRKQFLPPPGKLHGLLVQPRLQTGYSICSEKQSGNTRLHLLQVRNQSTSTVFAHCVTFSLPPVVKLGSWQCNDFSCMHDDRKHDSLWRFTALKLAMRWESEVKERGGSNSSAHREEAATSEINTNDGGIISQIPVENGSWTCFTEWGWRTLWSPHPSRQIRSVIQTSPMQHIKPQSRLYLENLSPTFSNPGTFLCFQNSWRLLKWFSLLLRSTVAVMTLTHLIFDSLSPTYSTVAHGNHCTNKLTHILWLSADSLSGVLMHAGVTLFSDTDVSSGKSHSHLQTISSPQRWSIYGQPRQAQQEHTKHTPGFKSSSQPSCLDSVNHRATVQIVHYNVLSPPTWTHFCNLFFQIIRIANRAFLMHT